MIRINNDYGIDIDDMNYTLFRFGIAGPKSKKPGEETKTILGYYSSIESVLSAAIKYMEKDALSEGEYSLTAALKKIVEIREGFGGLLKKVLEYKGN